jgi:hypothetical protein
MGQIQARHRAGTLQSFFDTAEFELRFTYDFLSKVLSFNDGIS